MPVRSKHTAPGLTASKYTAVVSASILQAVCLLHLTMYCPGYTTQRLVLPTSHSRLSCSHLSPQDHDVEAEVAYINNRQAAAAAATDSDTAGPSNNGERRQQCVGSMLVKHAPFRRPLMLSRVAVVAAFAARRCPAIFLCRSATVLVQLTCLACNPHS
jgi:hypothetical protein